MPIVLSSSKQKGQAPNDFEIQFSSPIELNNLPHEIAVKAMISPKWYNIHDQYYNNHQLKYFNGVEWKTISIPNGHYSIEQLEGTLHVLLRQEGDYKQSKDQKNGREYGFRFAMHQATGRLFIELKKDYKLDFTVGNIHKMLGFEDVILEQSTAGTSAVDMTNGVTTVLVHCSLVNGNSYNNTSSSDILFAFVPPSNANLGMMETTPANPTYVAVQPMPRIDKIRLYITDQIGRKLGMNGECTYYLHLRPARRLRRSIES